MRTSLNLQVQNSLISIARASDNLTAAQLHGTSGKRILKPSDDIPGTERALSLRSAIKTVNQLADNNLVAKPALQTAEAALNEVTKIINSVRDIAVGANNSAVMDKSAYLAQLDDISAQLLDVANTKYMDQCIFNGTATNKPAVTAEAGEPPVYAYTGNAGVKKTQILSWVSVPTNIPGSKVFNFDGSAGADSTDLFTMIARVRSAVESEDATALSNELKNIDANLDNVLSCRSRVGSWMQRMDDARSLLQDTKSTMMGLLSDVEDIDLPSAVIELQTQENIYQAALAINLRVMNMSLLSTQLAGR